MPPRDPHPPWLSRLARAVGLLGLEGASLTFAVWAVRSSDRMPPFARDNDLDYSLRVWEIGSIGLGVLAAVCLAAVVLVWKRGAGVALLERAGRRLAPLALSGLGALVFDGRLWKDREVVFSVLVLALGWGTEAALGTTWRAEPLLDLARLRAPLARALDAAVRRVPGWLDAPLLGVMVGAGVYAIYLSTITVEAHRNLHTSAFDLGLEDNLMWNLVHGGPLFLTTPLSGPTGSHLRNHATFFAFLMAPIYALAPNAETLLRLQSAILGAGAVPLFLYARRHLPPWVALVVAWAYLAYPPLHGANLYDFHYLPIGIPALWLVLYAVDSRRRLLAIVAALIAMSVREDVAAVLAVLGVFVLLTGAAAIEGALLALVGGAYFAVLKFLVMPRYMEEHTESFLNQYQGLVPTGGSGFGGVLETVIGNVPFATGVALERDKVAYALQIFAPLAALPLRDPSAFILVVPGVLFTLLSTGYPPLVQISFQYTSYWTAFLFIGVVAALARAGRGAPGDRDASVRQRAAVAGLVATTLACTLYQGAFSRRDSVRGGFEPFPFGTTGADRTSRRHLAQLLGELPPDARVSASEQLNPHVSNRAYAYTLRMGLYDADYLLFQVPPLGEEAERALPALESGDFGVVDDQGDMVLAQRGYSQALNQPLLDRLAR